MAIRMLLIFWHTLAWGYQAYKGLYDLFLVGAWSMSMIWRSIYAYLFFGPWWSIYIMHAWEKKKYIYIYRKHRCHGTSWYIYILMQMYTAIKLRLCIHLILSSRESGFCSIWAIVCSSWVRINAFTSQRSILNPEGDPNRDYVVRANEMMSRTLISNNHGSCLYMFMHLLGIAFMTCNKCDKYIDGSPLGIWNLGVSSC